MIIKKSLNYFKNSTMYFQYKEGVNQHKYREVVWCVAKDHSLDSCRLNDRVEIICFYFQLHIGLYINDVYSH